MVKTGQQIIVMDRYWQRAALATVVRLKCETATKQCIEVKYEKRKDTPKYAVGFTQGRKNPPQAKKTHVIWIAKEREDIYGIEEAETEEAQVPIHQSRRHSTVVGKSPGIRRLLRSEGNAPAYDTQLPG